MRTCYMFQPFPFIFWHVWLSILKCIQTHSAPLPSQTLNKLGNTKYGPCRVHNLLLKMKIPIFQVLVCEYYIHIIQKWSVYLILSQLRPTHFTDNNLFKIFFNTIVPSSTSISLTASLNFCTCVLHLSCASSPLQPTRFMTRV
jgi:hypothetical protein